MDTQLELSTNETTLAQHAEAIRVLGRRAVMDVLEIGRRLTEAKTIAGHGNWLPWLDLEFGWKERSAQTFMRVYEASKSAKFADLDLPISGLYLLAAPNTPADVRDEVLAIAENGEKISVERIKEMIEEARVQAGTDEKKKAERRLEEARCTYAKEVERLKEELEFSIPRDELMDTIKEQVQPLHDKIARYEERLEKIKKKEKEKPGPANEFGAARTSISYELRSLATALTITPAQMIEAQRVITKINGQPMLQGLGDDIAHAKAVVSWLNRFITATKGLKK